MKQFFLAAAVIVGSVAFGEYSREIKQLDSIAFDALEGGKFAIIDSHDTLPAFGGLRRLQSVHMRAAFCPGAYKPPSAGRGARPVHDTHLLAACDDGNHGLLRHNQIRDASQI